MSRLSKNIVLIVLTSYLAQFCLFAAFAFFAHGSLSGAPEGFFSRYIYLFLGVSLPFLCLFLTMLLLFRDDFIKVPSGIKLDTVNLANLITIFRIVSMPTLLVLLLASKEYKIAAPLFVFILLVFASDFLDGYLSRKAGEVTKIGKIMDGAGDYSLLIVFSIMFYYFKIIPEWLFGAIAARLAVQVVFVFMLIAIRKRIVPKTTIIGKLTIASIMILYALELLALALGWKHLLFVRIWEWIVFAIVLSSIVDKVIAFAQQLAEKNGQADSDIV